MNIYFVFILLIIFSLICVILKDNLLSVLSLATVSILVSILFFQFGAPVAGVFELSVGAGLITVLIILTISFIQYKRTEYNKKYSLIRTLFSGLVILVLFYLIINIIGEKTVHNYKISGWQNVSEMIWDLRAKDLVPQSLIILSTVLGVIALLRSEKDR